MSWVFLRHLQAPFDLAMHAFFMTMSGGKSSRYYGPAAISK
jgi:hypothetical protein